MGFLNNKNFAKKLIIILIFVILFNFISPQISFGGIGGVLFEPVKDLALTVADSIVKIMQKSILGIDTSILKIKYDHNWVPAAVGSIVGLAAAAISIGIGMAAIPVSGGLSVAAAIAAAKLAIGTTVISVGSGLVAGYITKQSIPNDFYLPLYKISPEEIFSNEILLFDVNFFNPKEDFKYTDTFTAQEINQQSSASALQSAISQWYFTIRNFAIVALLSILVYIGIRIIISSSAQDKAKYKQKLLDWIIAMFLLFFLHYIMYFAVTITELITNSLKSTIPQYMSVFDKETLEDYHWDFDQVVYKKYYNGKEITDEEITEQGLSENDLEIKKDTVKVDSKIFSDDSDEIYNVLVKNGFIENNEETGQIILKWPSNLMGKARIDAQLEVNGPDGDETLINQFGNTLIFLALVIYTVLFVFRYLKRLLILAFLTIIAPLVAMTYPLDKISDGSAQAFNSWLKEYVYNLLIQPVHLILYTVLMGSAYTFVADHLLYALGALGFMLQAEKIMRKFFGFEKASTLAGGSALGGALAMQGINSLRKLAKPKKEKNSKNNSDDSNGRVRYDNRNPDDNMNMSNLLNQNSNGQANSNIENSPESSQTTQQAMLDAYDEGFGTDSWDPQERDAMAREAYANENSGMNYSANEYEQILRDSGYSEDEIHEMISSDPRYSDSSSDTSPANDGQIPIPSTTYSRNSSTSHKPHRIRGIAKVVGKGLGGAIRYTAPKAARLAVRGTLAGAAGMVGIAAGLVSDDYSNVLKWGSAGVGTGWVAGGGISSGASSAIDASYNSVDSIGEGVENAISTYTMEAHGYEAEKQRQINAADKRAVNDKSRRELYAQKFKTNSKEELDSIMEDYKQYRSAGITDDDIIIKAMKSEEFGEDRVTDDKLILAQCAQIAKQEQGSSEDKLKSVERILKNNNASQSQIDKFVDGVSKTYLN